MIKNANVLFYVGLILTLFAACSNAVSTNNNERNINDTVTNKFISSDSGVCVFLDVEYFDYIDVYDSPNGSVIKKIKHDVENENYIMFELLEKNDSMFQVVAYWSSDDQVIVKGWVKKNKNIGVYSRGSSLTTLLLYVSPCRSSNSIDTKIEGYNPNMLTVVDFRNKWVNVKLELSKQTFEGWLAPDQQCCNIYTTCN